MITVVHCKVEQGKFEYIGRPNVLGNPFTHKQGTKADIVVASREEAVSEYRKWLYRKLHQKDALIISELKRLKEIALKEDLKLACWCYPKACHGDVVKEVLERSINRDIRKQKEASY